MEKDIVKEYLAKITEKYATGQAREHSYRPALEELFREITSLKVINEPKRSEYGAPDFVFIDKNIVAAYAEAKDINITLDEVEKSEQMIRYYGYSNLILTNCLEFRFYKNGLAYGSPVIIGRLQDCNIEADEANFGLLEDTITDFIKEAKEPIKSGLHLAKVMAGKARRIRDNINIFLAQSEDPKNADLLSIFEVIKKFLLADLDKHKFADMYAQTVVYGLFAARYSDSTLENFTRREARDLIPDSNPFLRYFFDHIAGPSYDPRIEYIVKELCEEFNHADVQAIVHNYYKTEKDSSRDPIVHFYEDFLQYYDAAERKKMGVFYTPLPVVRFIVRAIDDILKKEFGLAAGLADTSKIEEELAVQATDARYKDGIKKIKQPIHKVQILDPAAGTGTFLNEVILHVKESLAGQEGRWKNYVNEDLLPRLHGFELMMASYTIAHLKLSTTIKESGAELDGKQRLGVYLTNSLEKGEEAQKTLFDFGFGKAITEESNQANRIKNEMPIMVVIGNPPYSGVSSNETKHANNLVEKYKIEPGGKQKLQERKHWLNDDYVKFIALAEDLIENNNEGILGFITNHGYLSNPTFRGMRWHLMDTFDSIYILDLHGNSKKKEVAPDGSKDENVFNIQQGVSIIIAIKNKTAKKDILAKVYHYDIWGKRENKLKDLDNFCLENINWRCLNSRWPSLFFVPEGSGDNDNKYKEGFSIDDLFTQNTTGIVTMGDGFIIDENNEVLRKRVDDFLTEDITESNFKVKFGLGKNYADWIIKNKQSIKNDPDKIIPLAYRPFDNRFTYFDNKLVWRPRTNVMKNFISGKNIGLVFTRQAIGDSGYNHVMVSKHISDNRVFFSNKGIPNEAPLYLYNDDGTKIPNLKKEIVGEIEKIVGKIEPENVLDYIYAALHSPSYREKYKEFLKIDFPRVPYPKDEKQFFDLAKLGEELRHLHLMHGVETHGMRLGDSTDGDAHRASLQRTTYPMVGDNEIEKVNFDEKENRVYINKTQYFGEVPKEAWEFYIGGYQPAQKWLKDRKGRELSSDDLAHYQKIIVALLETKRIMGEIDKIADFR